MLKTRYIMIGGFLGAGKTTAIQQVARRLQAAGLRVGLITNDQSTGLADTAVLDSQGFETEEITGGCFCCKFNSLVEAADRLRRDMQPDVFIAEPVGSCTDLQATVSYPLRKLYGDQFQVAPLSVVIDPIRAQGVLGLKTTKRFSAKVTYIYEKQIEEADLLILNKIDLLSAEELVALETELRARRPGRPILRISARNGDGIDAWIDRITSAAWEDREAMDVDYDLYAEGEALLGWLNLEAVIRGADFDGNQLLLQLAAAVQTELQRQGEEIAHLKMTLTPNEGRDLAAVNLIRSEGLAELSHTLKEPLSEGALLLNLRAEAEPERIRAVVLNCLHAVSGSGSLGVSVRSLEAFRPGRPEPTHRLTAS